MSKTNYQYSAFNVWKGFAEYFISVPKESHFYEKGVLTPEEFVKAGDLITSKCATWSWSGGEPSKRKDYLPAEKQFLITKNVPCLRRAKTLMEEAEDEELLEGDDWVATHNSHAKDKDDEIDEIGIKSMSLNDKQNVNNASNEDDDDDDDDDIIDINDYNEEDLEDDDNATLPANATENDGILKTRTYDISITYDKYYQTPRVWLFGYDENGKPLDHQKVLEDIHIDYSNKTVTIEQHPHLSTSHASIHPCRHAEMMKKMIDRMSDEGKYVRVDLYLYIFLKFISAVIPTIDYDHTIQIEASASSSSKNA